jgi:hypothetical protein
MLHFALTPFCSWGHANSACRLLDIAVLMSSSHTPLPTGTFRKIAGDGAENRLKRKNGK